MRRCFHVLSSVEIKCGQVAVPSIFESPENQTGGTQIMNKHNKIEYNTKS